jgi:hypothetical protein
VSWDRPANGGRSLGRHGNRGGIASHRICAKTVDGRGEEPGADCDQGKIATSSMTHGCYSGSRHFAEDAETPSLASGVLSWCMANSCQEKFVVNSPFISSPFSAAKPSTGASRAAAGVPIAVDLAGSHREPPPGLAHKLTVHCRIHIRGHTHKFVETPVGMMYIGTRRVGQNVWVRMVEAVLPNLQQVAPIWETGHQEHAFSGPMLSRWVVPIDNTNTMFIELRHVSEAEGVTPAWWGDRTIMVPGQLAAESYEAGQRQPGDYEAQVSQRPIAIHGLEHIGATDRGVRMFRSQTRRGIRAVHRPRPHRPVS